MKKKLFLGGVLALVLAASYGIWIFKHNARDPIDAWLEEPTQPFRPLLDSYRIYVYKWTKDPSAYEDPASTVVWSRTEQRRVSFQIEATADVDPKAVLDDASKTSGLPPTDLDVYFVQVEKVDRLPSFFTGKVVFRDFPAPHPVLEVVMGLERFDVVLMNGEIVDVLRRPLRQ